MSRMVYGPFHIYVELVTDWVRLGVGDWLDIGLYKRPRGWRGRLGRLACLMDRHDWFLHDAPWMHKAEGPTTYRCLRCGLIR